jgi:hypothetical protein
MKRIIALLVLLRVFALPVQARVVNVASTDLSSHEPSDTTRGAYYTLSVDLPGDLSTVHHAWLELHVDVSTPLLEGFRDPVPVFEVYMLNGTLSGDPSPASVRSTRLPMSRPVTVGENRTIRIDVTDYVRSIIASPSLDHGLVIGSVMDGQKADFAIQPDAFGSGVPARLVIGE